MEKVIQVVLSIALSWSWVLYDLLLQICSRFVAKWVKSDEEQLFNKPINAVFGEEQTFAGDLKQNHWELEN